MYIWTDLEITSCCEHWFDGPHAVIIVMLWGQLFWAQPVHSHDFHGQWTSADETAWVQWDLSDEGIVRHHHGHGTEQRLRLDENEYVITRCRRHKWTSAWTISGSTFLLENIGWNTDYTINFVPKLRLNFIQNVQYQRQTNVIFPACYHPILHKSPPKSF